MDELASHGALLAARLVEVVGSPRQVADAPFMLRPLRVSNRLLDIMHGNWRVDRSIDYCADLLEPAPGAPELLVSAETKREVRELVMVAGLAGDALGLDVCQIDLSRIVSKWIGETEKNLGQVFDAAEAGHAILLFDEADSLFAKRTEVKSSVDRYSNLEVNYLLQRMEAFRGVSILTTNHDSAIDEAFRRRLSIQIQFPMPERDERCALWRSLVPRAAPVDPELDFEQLADRYEMSGGYIRNAMVRAAFLAAEDEARITMDHLLRAANLEYAAMGKVMHSSL